MLIEGVVGPQSKADGAILQPRLTKTGELGMSEVHARYQEACLRSNTFVASSGSVTIAATHVSPLAAGTGTPVIGLFNPAGSGKNLVLLATYTYHASGTPGGPLLWNVIPAPAGITAAGGAAMNSFTFQTSGSVSKVFANSALTGSVVATAARIIGGMTAVVIGSALGTFFENIEGSSIIPQGAFAGIAAFAQGSSHIVQAAMTWEEVPA